MLVVKFIVKNRFCNIFHSQVNYLSNLMDIKTLPHLLFYYKFELKYANRDPGIDKIKRIFYQIQQKMFSADVLNNPAIFNEYDKFHSALYAINRNELDDIVKRDNVLRIR